MDKGLFLEQLTISVTLLLSRFMSNLLSARILLVSFFKGNKDYENNYLLSLVGVCRYFLFTYH